MDPYRATRASRFPRSPAAAALARGRFAGNAAIVPLAVIFAAFFLPSVKGCDSDVIPVEEATKSGLTFLWIAPSYLAAGALVLPLLAAAVARRTPHRLGRQMAEAILGLQIACGALFSLAVALGITLERTNDSGALAVAAGMLAPPIAGLLLVVRGHTRRGWRRWSFFLAGYAVLSLPIGALLAAEGKRMRVGGWLYVIAYAAIIVLAIIAIWPPRKAPRASP